MQDIAKEIRGKLASTLGEENAGTFSMPASSLQGPFQEQGAPARFIRRSIPKKNYENLSKMVPISWI